MPDNPQQLQQVQIQLQIEDAIANGAYVNMALLNHNETEFAIDFIYVQPQAPKAVVRARVINSPKHMKRFLLALQEKLVTVENIQKTVAEYYKIRIGDLLSKRRSRSIARPRQVAMALAKDLTNHSLPEIGDAFGGRDHTTVLHACRRIKELRETERRIGEDYMNLLRTLAG